MEYIAHRDGKRVQTMKEHLIGTAGTCQPLCGKLWKIGLGLLLRDTP